MTTVQPRRRRQKMPEHHSTDKARPTKEDKIDAQMEDSFPASDPPSFSGGNHTIGAPTGRESESTQGGLRRRCWKRKRK